MATNDPTVNWDQEVRAQKLIEEFADLLLRRRGLDPTQEPFLKHAVKEHLKSLAKQPDEEVPF